MILSILKINALLNGSESDFQRNGEREELSISGVNKP
jgi:hypothetical protein